MALSLGMGGKPVTGMHAFVTPAGRTRLATTLDRGGLRLWDLGEAPPLDGGAVVLRPAHKRG
jgi:hypothetical protein